MPVAESELVGLHDRVLGFRFLIFFIAEFGTAVPSRAIASMLFLGGWGPVRLLATTDESPTGMNLAARWSCSRR
jgi:NADH:ubiquinone oxidoreductase subunit H